MNMKRAILFFGLIAFNIQFSVFNAVEAQNIIRPKIYCPNGIAINSYSGVLTYQRTDVSIPCRSMPLAAAFYYNSSANEENYNYGNGWSLGYEFRYKISNNDSLITIRYGNGRGDDYWYKNGVYVPPVGVFSTLTYENGVVTLTTREGTVYTFEDQVTRKLTQFRDRNNNSISLQYTGSKMTRLSDPVGRAIDFAYNAEGYLESLTDPAGRMWRYTYDENGNLTSVTNPANHTVHYGYNKENRLCTFTDPEGHSTWVTYNKDGQAHRVQTELTDKSIRYEKRLHQTVIVDYMGEDPENPGQQLPNQFTTYKWDEQGRVIEKTGNCCGSVAKYEYDRHNNVTRKEDANGNVTTYTYDENGNMLSMTDPLGNSESFTYGNSYGLPSSVTKRDGNSYLFTYDDHGNLTRMEGPDEEMLYITYNAFGQKISRTDALGNSVTYSYDDYGNLTTVTDPLGNTVTYRFSFLGHLRAVSNSSGNTISYNYDNDNNLISTTNLYNVSTYYDYDATGHITAIRSQGGTIQFTQDALGRLESLTNSLGYTTTYAYDRKGNVTSITDAMGNTTHYTYDGRNNCTAATDALGNTTYYSYDALRQLTGVQTPDGRQEMYEYDANGQLVKVSDDLGTLARIRYDDAGRRTQMLLAKRDNLTDNGNINDNVLNLNDYDVYNYTYDSHGRLTALQSNISSFQYTYDILGRCTSVTDDKGNSASYTYSTPGQLLSSSDSRGRTVSYAYDNLGRLASMTDALNGTTLFSYDNHGHLASVTDARGNSTQYSYDARGRLEQTLYPNGKSEQYTYDARNNIISYKDQAGSIRHFSYDDGNRLTTLTYPDGSTLQYNYDALNNLTSVTENGDSVVFSYDALGRLLSERLVTPETAPQGLTTNYNYDLPSRTNTITYPDQRTVSYQYDLRGRLIDITSAAADESEAQPVATYTHQLLNRLQSLTYGNGLVTGYTLDDERRLASISSNAQPQPGNQAIALSYTYDDLTGNLLSQIDGVDAVNSEFYQYDNLNRLTQFIVGTPDNNGTHPLQNTISEIENYSYDPLGNRISSRTTEQSSNNTISYTANAVNGYTAVGSQALQYDNNGNLVSDGVHTYQYDYANRLVSVDNGNTATYSYDPLGRRIRKVVGNTTTDYSYAGSQMIQSTTSTPSQSSNNATTQTTTDYLYSPRIDDALMAVQGNDKYYFHKNHLGSTMTVTDDNGDVVERYRYDAFGAPHFYNSTGDEMPTSAIGNDILFTGREYDSETGLYYYRARTFNPALGRFQQQDPIGYGDGMNMYAYVRNNPTNLIDPSGLEGCGGDCDPYPHLCKIIPSFCEGQNNFSIDLGANVGFDLFLDLDPKTNDRASHKLPKVPLPWFISQKDFNQLSELLKVGKSIDAKIGINITTIGDSYIPFLDVYVSFDNGTGTGTDFSAHATFDLIINDDNTSSFDILSKTEYTETAMNLLVGGYSSQSFSEPSSGPSTSQNTSIGFISVGGQTKAKNFSFGVPKNFGVGAHESQQTNYRVSLSNILMHGVDMTILGGEILYLGVQTDIQFIKEVKNNIEKELDRLIYYDISQTANNWFHNICSF